MITLAAPAFLVAGTLLALVPLALHMLARTPPDRRPLPTARFLEVDRRTRLRLRRPADLLLLAMRMALLLLLGAAFARPAWVADREGGARVVLLDAGAGMAGAWEAAVAVAADRLGEGGTLVVFDTAARVIEDGGAALDSLRRAGPGAGPSSYLAALRGLRLATGWMRADSADAVLITRARWGAWSAALPTVREAAWPARIEVVDVDGEGGEASRAMGDSIEPAERPATVIGADDHVLRPYVEAALGALGFDDPAPAGEESDLAVVLSGVEAIAGSLPGRRVVVLGGRVDRGGFGRAWNVDAADRNAARPGRGRLVFPGGEALAGWRPVPGAPADEARVLAVWEDGRPAAAAIRRGDGCLAYLAAEPEAGGAAADPALPHLIRTLADGCEPRVPGEPSGSALDGVALDSGALRTLRADQLPRAAELAVIAPGRGRALTRALLALALVVAAAEIAVARRRGGAW